MVQVSAYVASRLPFIAFGVGRFHAGEEIAFGALQLGGCKSMSFDSFKLRDHRFKTAFHLPGLSGHKHRKGIQPAQESADTPTSLDERWVRLAGEFGKTGPSHLVEK